MSDWDHFDLQPTLIGDTISLRPLASDDFEPLYAVAADPQIWEQHPEPSRYQRPVFESFFAGGIASKGTLVVIEGNSGSMIGSSRYYEWDPDRKEVAIGYTFLARSHWGGPTNAEMKRLMLAHAFRWARRVWFHVGKSNWRSRKAMEKIGGRFSHETQRTGGGILQDYVYFSIDAET